MLTRQLPVVALVALALLSTAALATASSGAPEASAASKNIASATTSDFRAVVTAKRHAGAGGAPEATIAVTTYERAAGWRTTGERELRGTYFWHSVTGPRAVCRLELRTLGRPRLLVQLLVSPSVGCGSVAEIALR